MRSLHYYMLGTGTWFMGYGIQGVMFAWLVTMVLRGSPEMVGVAQMTLLLPGMLLILIGGSYADRFGGRRIAMAAQAVGAFAPLLLLALLWFDALSFSTMLVYAVLMGCAQAFVTPARDGLLNQVAAGRVQRTVMLTSMVQFGMQMLGFLIAALADTTGPLVILATQSLILAIGVLGFRRIPRLEISRPANHALMKSVIEGARTVLSSVSMRMVVLQNVAMGMFFMGSYMVTMPLLVREVYDGSAQDLAL
ncbi:MAG: MFS transporter, partial [Gammaproteobacteria bacterium]|nr:MFS transporter [Gammaproteobacteria bacterium]